MIKTFGEYISFWSVADVLISKRVQLCDKRHKKHQLHLLSPAMSLGQTTDVEELLLAMMPPGRDG